MEANLSTLPFLKRKDASQLGVIISTRTPDESKEDKNDPNASLEACGQAILRAIKSNDSIELANSIKDLFELADSEPHEEGPHTEKHSYADQNRSAGEE